jgi:hypothetical protein
MLKECDIQGERCITQTSGCHSGTLHRNMTILEQITRLLVNQTDSPPSGRRLAPIAREVSEHHENESISRDAT